MSVHSSGFDAISHVYTYIFVELIMTWYFRLSRTDLGYRIILYRQTDLKIDRNEFRAVHGDRSVGPADSRTRKYTFSGTGSRASVFSSYRNRFITVNCFPESRDVSGSVH